jgi:CMP-2-keto-3-deoxyoctulosonic acid synthetase
MAKTKVLEAVVERAAALPEEAQVEVASVMAEVIDEIETRTAGVRRLNEDERKGIERGLEAMRQGRFASDEQIAAILRKTQADQPIFEVAIEWAAKVKNVVPR